ncbi:MAG TPA: four helix bundle protein [Pirellulales bacterium]|nr:four helix bundle protein [Pirellulales bacterium]
MRNEQLEKRTKAFAVRVVKMFGKLPKRAEADILGRQALRSGTSVGANYREATRARSKPELVSKFAIVEQELSETMYWFELLVESGIVANSKMSALHREADELLRITVASIKTLKATKLNDGR